jgi:hypothetical protein
MFHRWNHDADFDEVNSVLTGQFAFDLRIDNVPRTANILRCHSSGHFNEKCVYLYMSYSERFSRLRYFTVQFQRCWLQRDTTTVSNTCLCCLNDEFGTVNISALCNSCEDMFTFTVCSVDLCLHVQCAVLMRIYIYSVQCCCVSTCRVCSVDTCLHVQCAVLMRAYMYSVQCWFVSTCRVQCWCVSTCRVCRVDACLHVQCAVLMRVYM